MRLTIFCWAFFMQPKQSLTVGELDEINKLRRLPIPHFGLFGESFVIV